MPQDFKGIPTVHSQAAWFFSYSPKRKKGDIEALWQLASQAMERPISEIDEDLFDRCCQVRMLGIGKLTIGLFWINPQRFLRVTRRRWRSERAMMSTLCRSISEATWNG